MADHCRFELMPSLDKWCALTERIAKMQTLYVQEVTSHALVYLMDHQEHLHTVLAEGVLYMKKLMLVASAFVLLTSVCAIAQDTTSRPDMQQPTSTADNTSTAVSLRGTVGDDGKTFVSDEDNKTWTVTNPNALKGHAGQPVIVKAQVDKVKNEIHVTSVKKAKGKKQGNEKEPMSEQMPK